MSGGSHSWVTSLSLGLPGARSRLSQLRPHPSHTPAAPTAAGFFAPTRETPPSPRAPPWLLPSALSHSLPESRLQRPSQLLPPRGTSGVPPPFFQHLAPPHGPALSSPVHIHWLDFYNAPPPRLSIPRLGQRAVCQRRRGWAAPEVNLWTATGKADPVRSGEEG